LRRQLRIQIHVQFFSALLLSSVVSLMWCMLVHYDLLTTDVMANTVIARNQVRFGWWWRRSHSCSVCWLNSRYKVLPKV